MLGCPPNNAVLSREEKVLFCDLGKASVPLENGDPGHALLVLYGCPGCLVVTNQLWADHFTFLSLSTYL